MAGQNYSISRLNTQAATSVATSSLLKGLLNDQELDFKDVLRQMAKGEGLQIPHTGEQFNMKEDTLAASLAVNRWLADQLARDKTGWDIYKFTQKLEDELSSFSQAG